MKKLTAIFLAAIISVCVFAQPTIKVQTQNLVALDEQFNVTFIIEGEKSVSGFEWEPGDDFQLVWGPQKGSSTSISIVNGKKTTSAQTTFTYILMPKAAGRFNIPSATVAVGNATITSQPVSVEVVQGSGSSRPQSSGGVSGTSAESGDIFLKLSLSKNRVVVGEAVSASLKLYQRANIAGFEDVHFPDFNGFWSEETATPQNIEFHRENVGDAIYNVALLRGWTLVPQRQGDLRIDPAEIVCLLNVRAARTGTGSIFDSFFQDEYQTIRKRVSTNPVTVKVNPLPSPQPSSFGGGVGNFRMNVKISRDSLKTHEAASLVVTLSGNGNVSMLAAPKISFPPDFEVYDVKESESSDGKTFEYPFIPRSHGEFVIPAFEYSYYNVNSSSYLALRSDPMTLSVGKSDEAVTDAGGIVHAPAGKDVKNLATDIRYMKTVSGSLRPVGTLFAFSPLFFLIVLVLVAVAIASFLFLRSYYSRRSDVVGTRKRSATKMAMKRLSSASSYLSAGVRTAFYEELHRALLGFVSDKLNMDAAELSKDNIREVLSSKGVPGDVVDRFISLLDSCEYARYSPDTGSDDMKTNYQTAVDVISGMDSILGKAKSGRILPLIVIMLSLPLSLKAAPEDCCDSLWTRGCEAYSSGMWEDSARAWEQIVSSGYASADLYYNIGNAHFKNGETALAIIAWKRALRLDASHQDARFNLEFARERVQDRIEPVPEFFLKTWARKICYVTGSTTWAVIFLVCLAAALAFAVVFLLGNSSRIRKTGFFGALAGVLLMVISLSAAISQRNDVTDRSEAVVTSPVAGVRSSPDSSGSLDLFVLHEGTEVSVIERLGDWSGIQLSDGRKGWIKNGDIETI